MINSESLREDFVGVSWLEFVSVRCYRDQGGCMGAAFAGKFIFLK
jgi:hypothetical protein